MSLNRLSRRALLRGAMMGSAGIVLAACQPKIVEVTKIVEKPVEKIVEKEKVVKETVQVEVVKEVTKVVEKQVAAPKEPISLTIMHCHGTYFEFGETTVDPQFEQRNPGVTIKREMVPGYTRAFYPKLIAMHVAGTPWDCAELPSDVGTEYQLYLKGVIKDLTPFVEKDQFDLDKFWPIAIETCKYKGQALPYLPILIDPGQGIMFYNKALLKEAGIDEPTPAWTWEGDFADALAKGKKAFEGKQGVFLWPHFMSNVYGYQTALDAWNTTILDPDGRVLLIDNEQGTACLKYFYDLMQAGLAQQESAVPNGSWQAFMAGQTIFSSTFMPVIPWVLGEVKKAGKFEGGATLAPKGPGPNGKNGAVLNPHYMGMSAGSKNPDMAWEYLKWYTGPEMSQPLWDKGLITALKETWEKPGNLDQWPGYKDSAKLLDTVPLSSVPWNFKGAELYDALVQGMDRAWLGKMDFKAALDDTAAAMRKVLEQPMS